MNPTRTPSYLPWIHRNFFILYFCYNFFFLCLGISSLGVISKQFSENVILYIEFCLIMYAPIIIHQLLLKNQPHLEPSYDGPYWYYCAFHLPRNVALWFLFSVVLFDVFYIQAWMNHLELVWQPNWVKQCIQFVKNHLALPPIYRKLELFYLSIEQGSEPYNDIWNQYIHREAQFIETPYGQATLFYHFIRTILFIPIVTALTVILWYPLEWEGMDRFDPARIHNFSSFMRSCMWSIVMLFFFSWPTWGIICHIDLFAPTLLNIETYIRFKLWHMIYLFIIPPIRFFCGWLIFWKRVCQILFHWILRHAKR